MLTAGSRKAPPHPGAPGKDNERIGANAAKKQCLTVAEPFFEQREARPVLAGFHFGHERCSIATEWIQIDIMAGATETAGAG
jgi:hypothetical protein